MIVFVYLAKDSISTHGSWRKEILITEPFLLGLGDGRSLYLVIIVSLICSGIIDMD
jgi:hypothetical protein